MTAVAPPPRRHLPDDGRAIETITRAFAADPIVRWCWPDDRQYLEAMPVFTRAFAGRAFSEQTVVSTPAYEGVALWLPPNVASDDAAVDAVLQETVDPGIRYDLYGIFEEMAGVHPATPHWYLPLIGVDPAFQGRGHGGSLLRGVLERCDRDGLEAYLEATSERNIPLYQRHGFQAIGTIQVGSSPPLIPMVRRPRRVAGLGWPVR